MVPYMVLQKTTRLVNKVYTVIKLEVIVGIDRVFLSSFVSFCRNLQEVAGILSCSDLGTDVFGRGAITLRETNSKRLEN